MKATMLSVPIGTVIDYAGQTLPSGYLECDGSAVGRDEYPKLFAAIGTLWGSGDGSTTFNLPDLNGRACIGKGSRDIGATGGSETHTLTVNEMPSHAHTMDSSGTCTTTGTGAHRHSLMDNNTGGSATYWCYTSTNAKYKWLQDRTQTDGSHNHTVPNHTHTMQNSGGGSAHSIMQPYAVVRKAIRAA